MKKEIIKFLVLLMVALGAGPASSAFWQWSTTAANNGNSDPTINFQEGMSPSSVNDSARAVMAALAAYNNDTSGFAAASGTASAISFASAQGYTDAASLSGRSVTFLYNVSASNNAGITLTVDGISGIIYTAFGVQVPAASMVLGGVYSVTYYSADSSFRLHDFFQSPFNVPLGSLIAYTGSTPPNSNFIFPAGQCLSTTTYAAYWALLGSPASGSCPGGQFAVLDARGRVPVGLDNLNGTPANRLTAGANGCGTAMTSVGATCVNGTEGKNLVIANLNSFTPTGTFSASLTSGVVNIPQQGNSGIGSPVTAAFSEGANNKSVTTLSVTVNGSVSGALSINALGSGTAHPTTDPNVAVTYILRVL